MAENTQASDGERNVNDAVAQGGAYEVIRKRLLEQASQMEAHVDALNAEREAGFGKASLEIINRARVRTDNNCVPRDIVRVGDHLLFGYNVFIGLKKETAVGDVFATYRLVIQDGKVDITTDPESVFLADPRFVADFQELYAYYKNTTLLRMQVVNHRLLVTFQIGRELTDIRVFRWSIGQGDDPAVDYIDDRGERELPRPTTHEFEWVACGREHQVQGKYPHYSILDKVFVETTGGDVTIKVEDNTEAGFGIYDEPVEEANQALDDAEILYTQVGDLILLKIRPYREDSYRYLVFNPLVEKVLRIDAIGIACRELPEDHGIVFPGGCYLQTGELRQFEEDVTGLRFSRKLVSPNGEDVLYVFYEAAEGRYGLLSYNLIKKQLQNPIYAHGYSLFEDGRLVVFHSESSEPTRNHPMQVWQTTFYGEDYAITDAEAAPELAKIGNNELVRAIADLYSLVRQTRAEDVSLANYNELVKASTRVLNNFFWLADDAFEHILAAVKELQETSELVVDEYEKVAAIQTHANDALREAEQQQQRILHAIQTSDHQLIDGFVAGLGELRQQRGHLLTIRELRYIDVERIDVLESELVAEYEAKAQRTVEFLLQPSALAIYKTRNEDTAAAIPNTATVAELTPLVEQLDDISSGLDTLTDVLGTLQVQDATQRTQILESISEIYAALNHSQAQARLQSKELGSKESIAEFSAQFTLLSQSISAALNHADSPDACDEELSRLSVQLEELEGRFGEHDEFLDDIITKREELFDTFESRKQALVDEQQRRAQNLLSAGERILEGVKRRTAKIVDADGLNTFFSSDPMVHKLRELVASLRDLKDSVKAEDLDARLRAMKDDAFRTQRDKRDLFEESGTVIKLGNHRFSVNSQELDLTIVHADGELRSHLTGTGYSETLVDAELEALRDYWSQALPSETDAVYRAEHLAACLLRDARGGVGMDIDTLQRALAGGDELTKLIREYATPRYQEGYERGVHDHDCAKIILKLLPKIEEAGLLRFSPQVRAVALLFWHCFDDKEVRKRWVLRARSSASLESVFGHAKAYRGIARDLAERLVDFIAEHQLALTENQTLAAAEYLAHELAEATFAPVCAQEAYALVSGMTAALESKDARRSLTQTARELREEPLALFRLYRQWLAGYTQLAEQTTIARFVDEAAVLMLTADLQQPTPRQLDLSVEIGGLLGQHARIKDQTLTLSVDEYFDRLDHHLDVVVPAYQAFQKRRHTLAEATRRELSLDEFKPRPLSSFVRNRLINEVYLPLVGDNLAKQMGTAGDTKRTDLMGLLLLISPPGYGKTTLMEYVASRLGLVFLKINGPALGHDVRSLDPAQAPNATAGNELNKLNLGLEMGNNVMLYVDDIQHTHPEFLQKFISLCDGTRRIEGVWRGDTKTYDLRGRKFCVVMAGNPYTESGEVFQVPDMLANRADIYNLGDVLSGREEVFALSYIENSLTSNQVLAPLATRSMDDVYRFVEVAQGHTVATTEFDHSYSGAEMNEISTVLKKMFQIQEVILKVNLEYIRSSATDDAYRTEPTFLLQGSYRNMNKMAEKISAVMNDEELDDLIADHYVGEAQLLTNAAEANLLKLAQLRGNMTLEQQTRWEEIVRDFKRHKSVGGDDADAGTKVAHQLASITESLSSISSAIASSGDASTEQLRDQLLEITEAMQGSKVQIVNQPSKVVEQAMTNMANLIETSFLPVVASMDKKIDLDLAILKRVSALNDGIEEFRTVILDLEADRKKS